MRVVRKSKTILFASLGLWLLAVGSGLQIIASYENTAGAGGRPPAEWPAASRIRRVPGMPTLVMMVHPHCPCSRASIGELALLMVKVQGRVNANVMFVKPKGFAEDWEKTDLWSRTAMIPGINVSVDDEGVETRRFGSQTSGQVLLYDADGRLLFGGGITAARGHSGDNTGRSAIVALVSSEGEAIQQTPVFGCPLFNKDANEKSRDSCDANHGK